MRNWLNRPTLASVRGGARFAPAKPVSAQCFRRCLHRLGLGAIRKNTGSTIGRNPGNGPGQARPDHCRVCRREPQARCTFSTGGWLLLCRLHVMRAVSAAALFGNPAPGKIDEDHTAGGRPPEPNHKAATRFELERPPQLPVDVLAVVLSSHLPLTSLSKSKP